MKKNQGFSLIELLVVISILAVVAGMGFAILASSLKTTAKTTVQNRVKQNGNIIVDEMSRNARTAATVQTSGSTTNETIVFCADTGVPTCTTPILGYQCVAGTNVSPVSNGYITRTEYTNGTPGSAIMLTNTDVINGVEVVSCNFSFSSQSNTFTINFQLAQGVSLQTNYGNPVQQTFSSTVTLRSTR